MSGELQQITLNLSGKRRMYMYIKERNQRIKNFSNSPDIRYRKEKQMQSELEKTERNYWNNRIRKNNNY